MPIGTSAARGILLDTHIRVELQSGSSTLSKRAVASIDLATSTRSVYVPLIAIWEIAMLAAKKRVQFDRPVQQWVEESLDKPGINVLPITPRIAIEAALLPEPMHKDPADRMIVASAVLEDLTLVTCDRPMLAYAKLIGLDCIEG